MKKSTKNKKDLEAFYANQMLVTGKIKGGGDIIIFEDTTVG